MISAAAVPIVPPQFKSHGTETSETHATTRLGEHPIRIAPKPIVLMDHACISRRCHFESLGHSSIMYSGAARPMMDEHMATPATAVSDLIARCAVD